MNLKLKSQFHNLEVKIADDATIGQLRELCSKELATKDVLADPVDIVLLWNAKLVSDDKTLKELKILEDSTVFFVVKKPAKVELFQKPPVSQAAKIESQTAKPMTTPSIPTSSGSTSGFSQMGSITNQLMDGLNNPNMQFLENVGDTTEIARLLSSPLFMESMTNLNPEYKRFFETYPEIASLFSDPATMKQMLDMMKNPSALKDALRNQDNILSQLQNIPGAMDQYMTLMNDLNRVKESTLSRFGPPAAAPVGVGSTNTDSSTANISGEAMPNPWGSSQQSAQKQSSKPQTTGEEVPLFRDLIRSVTLTTTPDDPATLQMLDQMKEIIRGLSPRGKYGLTQYIAGLQILREESIDLVAMILNYQLSCIRSTRSFIEGAAGLPSEDGQLPMDTGNEESYQAQLEELNSMGFSNKAENIKALQYAYGDVSGAVNWLLNRRPGQ